MVEPTNFCSNSETKKDNQFMKDLPNVDTQKTALAEFNSYIQMLRNVGVEVETFKQQYENAPDSIFLNNWFSTHRNEYFPEGPLIIYPMKTMSRRIERNQEMIDRMKKGV